jgi:hypothetical protein
MLHTGLRRAAHGILSQEQIVRIFAMAKSCVQHGMVVHAAWC